MWFVWWLRWHGLRLIFGTNGPHGKDWGQPARVRVPVEAPRDPRRGGRYESNQ